MVVGDKYTRSAKGRMCQVRVPGVCRPDPTTTVLAHLNGAGMAMKHSSIHGAYACHECHAWLDHGWTRTALGTRAVRDLVHLQAVIRTQEIMIKDGVLLL